MNHLLTLGLFLLIATLILACSSTEATPTATATAVPTPTQTPSPSPTPSATPTSVPTATSEPEAPTALEIMTAAAAKGARSLHFEMEIKASVDTGGGRAELPIQLEGDFQPPDRSEGTMVIDLGFVAVRSQVINVGDTTYILDESTSEWSASTASSAVLTGPGVLLSPDPETLESLELLGVESIDGVDSYHLKAIAPAGTLDDSVGRLDVEYWVGLDDGNLVQVVASGSVDLRADSGSLSKMSTTGTADVATTIKLSEFGKSVSVNVPENVAPTPDPDAEPVDPGTPPPLPPLPAPTAEPATPTPSSMLTAPEAAITLATL